MCRWTLLWCLPTFRHLPSWLVSAHTFSPSCTFWRAEGKHPGCEPSATGQPSPLTLHVNLRWKMPLFFHLKWETSNAIKTKNCLPQACFFGFTVVQRYWNPQRLSGAWKCKWSANIVVHFWKQRAICSWMPGRLSKICTIYWRYSLPTRQLWVSKESSGSLQQCLKYLKCLKHLKWNITQEMKCLVIKEACYKEIYSHCLLQKRLSLEICELHLHVKLSCRNVTPPEQSSSVVLSGLK